MQIDQRQLGEILADFSALGKATYLDDPVLRLGGAVIDRDGLGMPRSSPDLPRMPVAMVERHQALWAHPDNDARRQREVWTEQAIAQGMQRLDQGAPRVPELDGWLIAEWLSDGGGMQLRQPDGHLFVYALCQLTREWVAAARRHRFVLVLHGPRLGLRVPADLADAERTRATELEAAHRDGLVTGGLIRWGQVLGG